MYMSNNECSFPTLKFTFSKRHVWNSSHNKFFFYLRKGIYHKIKNISMDSMFMDMDSLFSGL